MHLIFVVYDSVTNSIFDSQIALPLVQRKQQNSNLNITVISFEKKIDQHLFTSIINTYPQLNFIFLKKYIFITRFSLLPAIKQLQKNLSNFNAYQLIARGPVAGYLCLKASDAKRYTQIIIQARGLLYEEYCYTHHGAQNKLLRFIHAWRAQQYKKIEATVYTQESVIIEAVSSALKDYLISTYQACPKNITIAQQDIPAIIPMAQVHTWRIMIRNQLKLSETTTVYCYNGSLRAWQCPQQTIDFFYKQLNRNARVFLLVLTQDTKFFEQLLLQKKIDSCFYAVLTVPHQEIYKYLAAADIGLIFRQKNILNWVSRPTKILEYQAVGLPIIHNNTIAMISS